MKRPIWMGIFALLAVPALSEVAVKKTPLGAYYYFINRSRIEQATLLSWQPPSFSTDTDYLNTGGDNNGDLPPVTRVLPANKLQIDPTPLVVWARSDGSDHEIVWSRWVRGSGWTTTALLGSPNTVQDSDVQLFMDQNSDVHVLWESGGGAEARQIYYSKFLNGAWLPPEVVSLPTHDARTPRFVYVQRQLFIRYEDWSVTPPRSHSFLKEDFD